MAADDGKKRTKGADPQALIDAEAFWDDQSGQAEEEEVTAPHQVRPQAPPPAPRAPAGAGSGDEADDPDLAVVGPADLFASQTGRGASRPRSPVPPAARPRQPQPPPKQPPRPRARPRPPAQAQVRPSPPPTGRPAGRRPKPLSMPEPEVDVEVVDTSPSPVKIGLSLVAVVALCAFLGWFLIGRHAGEEERPDAEEPLDSIEQVPSEPQAAPKPDLDASAKAALSTKDPTVTVTIEVTSDPAGAQVFVDGEHRGVTPATVRGLPTSGEASLKIVLDGHKPWEQKIALDDKDLNREVNAGLVKLSACKAGTGFIYVSSHPPGATIELDGKRLPGKTPKVINDVCAIVPHKLKLQKAGFRPWLQEVRIKPEDIHNVEAKLDH